MLEQYMPSFSWFNSTKVIFGAGKLSELPAVVDDVAGSQSRVFLVTGRSNLRATGILDKVIAALGESRISLFDRTTPFPSPALVEEALKECREVEADIVVAIGGGSAMDLGKAVAILTAHDGEVIEYATRERQLERPGLPFVAVPTTSGSSSEVTSGSALWDLDAKRHMGLSSPMMFPTVALVDPELTMTMPKTLAAASGMDAFTSAFESYWSLESEPISDAIDLEVIRIFTQNLERSCIQGDLESRASCAL
ncbi:MAG: iron-containing alcohol dehydrogenase, partial [Chloroflexi bacterium]|nr:iron-containing alcohol dehydrogenase [Chloroflexota bacterium]